MNLAIVHYHLNRGGVARVIENQLLALDAVLDQSDRWRVAILYGGRKAGWNEELSEQLHQIDLQLVEVAGLDYDNSEATTDSSSTDETPASSSEKEHLSDKLTGTLQQIGFTPESTVVQIHNHSLGKNTALSASVRPLAEQGYALLLQAHDFAEDFRPANYARLCSLDYGDVYPQSPRIHYAVLNSRDYSILNASGVESSRLHLLPNPVPTLGRLPDRGDARKKLHKLFGIGPEQRYLLYPIRGIRRKNLGETLLTSILSPEGTVVGVTLAPLNPAETAVYTMWKETAAELAVSCCFEVGAPGALEFGQNMAASDVILTTSLAEGFGMVMLEPWPVGRTLVGRNLPEITSDFTENGLRFEGLWDRLNVPLDWIGRERFLEQAAAGYRKSVAAFDRPLPADWEQGLQDKIHDGMVDFGDLDEAMQKDVLNNVVETPVNRQAVLGINPGLEKMLASDSQTSRATIEHNVQAVKQCYSLVPSGRRLLNVLQGVLQAPRDRSIDRLARPERILDSFLDARRFRMIRGLS